MGLFDDLLVNEDYNRGFEDGREDYKSFVIDKISPFLDEIIDKEVERLLPQVVYHYTQIQRENTQLYRLCLDKDETIQTQGNKIQEMYDLLRESKEEILRLQDLEIGVDNG